MARSRVIVGIGEALLCEFPDRTEAGGLAVKVAQQAAALGHVGVAISRIGQDRAGDELTRLLTQIDLNTAHLQSDPDLPTGRLIVRSVAGRTTRTLSARAAFDNLQWDFDLVDVAQQAEAAVFGGLARREGQSRSVIKQFLAECTGALRVFDMTNRADDSIDRVEARSGFEFCEAAVVDGVALKALVPSWPASAQMREPALEVCAANRLSFVATVHRGPNGETLSIHNGEGSWSTPKPYPIEQHEARIVGLLHGLLDGAEYAKALEESGPVV